ncbi:hypothetical protein F4778DRAFT_736448 [Xylariomycetidae sp. FL2044]|nr:hypothetical protein F4778DRAFT_736448 [Xylariomycetidae sp. FL2044]
MMDSILVYDPTKKISASSTRKAHSHAARAAHARTRRLRVAHYTEQKKAAARVEDENSRRRKASERLETGRQDELVSYTPQGTASELPKSIGGAFEHEPLASFLRSLTQREHFLFDHYVTVVLPDLYLYCSSMRTLSQYHPDMAANWLFFGSTDIEILRGFLLTSCRHLSEICAEREYVQLAIEYRLHHVKSLRESMSAGSASASRVAVTKALVLASDDVMIRDLPSASQHLLGAIRIIEAAGGTQALNLSGTVRFLLRNQIEEKRLLDRPQYSPEELWI